jgi:hypothetical protein
MAARALLASAILAIIFGAFSAESAKAQTISDITINGGDVAGLKDQLEKGLKCRRKVEFAFVHEVVNKVEKGRLSRQLVVECFAFARRRAKQYGTQYAFPYFQRALEERAKRAGTPLDIDTSNLYPTTPY